MVDKTEESDSQLLADFKLDLDKLVCPKTSRQLEFVCTKKDSKLCLDCFCCSKCIITDYADLFQWMTILEDFFLPNNQAKLSTLKDERWSGIKELLNKEDQLTNQFEQKVEQDVTATRDKLKELKEKVRTEFEKVQQSVDDQRKTILKEFQDNYSELDKALNPPKEEGSELTISTMEQLQEFLEVKVKAENDKQEKKLDKTSEALSDKINSISLMQSNEKQGETLAGMIDKTINFGICVDRFNFYRKYNQLPVSKYNYNELKNIQTMDTDKRKVTRVALLAEEKHIACCDTEKTVTIWDYTTGQVVQTLSGFTDKLYAIIALRDGSLVSADGGKKIKIWNPIKGTCEQELTGHTLDVTCLMELPYMSLISGSLDKSLRIWDLKNKEKPLLSTFTDFKQNTVHALTIVRHNLLAVSSAKDINLITFDELTINKTLSGHTGLVKDLSVVDKGDDKRLLLSCGDDKKIRIWDLDQFTTLHTLSGHKGNVARVFMFNAEILVSSGEDTDVRFWDINTGESKKTLQAHETSVSDMVIKKDGTLVTCGGDKMIKFWVE